MGSRSIPSLLSWGFLDSGHEGTTHLESLPQYGTQLPQGSSRDTRWIRRQCGRGGSQRMPGNPGMRERKRRSAMTYRRKQQRCASSTLQAWYGPASASWVINWWQLGYRLNWEVRRRKRERIDRHSRAARGGRRVSSRNGWNMKSLDLSRRLLSCYWAGLFRFLFPLIKYFRLHHALKFSTLPTRTRSACQWFARRNSISNANLKSIFLSNRCSIFQSTWTMYSPELMQQNEIPCDIFFWTFWIPIFYFFSFEFCELFQYWK